MAEPPEDALTTLARRELDRVLERARGLTTISILARGILGGPAAGVLFALLGLRTDLFPNVPAAVFGGAYFGIAMGAVLIGTFVLLRALARDRQ
jgi:hypothetical protein